jgi:hypothetical protein
LTNVHRAFILSFVVCHHRAQGFSGLCALFLEVDDLTRQQIRYSEMLESEKIMDIDSYTTVSFVEKRTVKVKGREYKLASIKIEAGDRKGKTGLVIYKDLRER